MNTMFRALTLALICISIGACTTPGPAKQALRDESATDLALLNGLQRNLPGLYGNYAQVWTARQESQENAAGGHWRLRVSALNSLPGEAWFSLLQYPATDATQGRRSLLHLGYDGGQLTLRFAPDPDGAATQNPDSASLAATARFLPGCEIRINRAASVLAGQTNPSACRLEGSDGSLLALVKDFAMAANAIDIGDRVLDPVSGEHVGEDQVFRFRRMLQYQGWAGVKQAGDEDWRLARPLQVWSDGGSAELLDVSGQPLGYRIRLARIPWRSDQEEILRLDLIDNGSGEILAYSWADHGASSVGLNLGWIQVGLTQILP